jgi:hypothetical protein
MRRGLIVHLPASPGLCFPLRVVTRHAFDSELVRVLGSRITSGLYLLRYDLITTDG